MKIIPKKVNRSEPLPKKSRGRDPKHRSGLSYTNRPMQLFGGLGMAAMALGVASGFLALAMKLFMGMDMTGNPSYTSRSFSGLLRFSS